MKSDCEDSVGKVSASGGGGGLSLAPKNIKDLQSNPGYENVDIFTYEEMKMATKQFRPDYILGEGGFGVVYKGVIDDSVRAGYKSTKVAIKELNPEGFQGDREWLVKIILFHLCQIMFFGECVCINLKLLLFVFFLG